MVSKNKELSLKIYCFNIKFIVVPHFVNFTICAIHLSLSILFLAAYRDVHEDSVATKSSVKRCSSFNALVLRIYLEIRFIIYVQNLNLNKYVLLFNLFLIRKIIK